MPGKVRTQREHRRRREGVDARVCIWGERLQAALTLQGLGNRGAARRLGIQPQLLEYYLNRRHARCRAPLRRAMAALTGLPEAWLAGELRFLPWVRERWEDLQEIAWPALHTLIVHLQVRTQADSSEDETGRLVEIRRDLAQLEGLFGAGRLPRHLTASPPAGVTDLLGVLGELALTVTRPSISRTQAAKARTKLQAIERSWAIHASDRPSVAQIVQYRLIGRCWHAWRRQAVLRFPDFNPDSLPEPVVTASSSGPSARLPAAWREWFAVQDRLHELLSLASWQSALLGEKGPRDHPEDETIAVPLLGHVIALVLRPWLEGATTKPPALLLPARRAQSSRD
jgi:hypothetical protein